MLRERIGGKDTMNQDRTLTIRLPLTSVSYNNEMIYDLIAE